MSINIHLEIEKDNYAHLRIMGNALLAMAGDEVVSLSVPPVDENTKGAIIHTDGIVTTPQDEVVHTPTPPPPPLNTAPANTTGLDPEGISWDERIHSAKKTHNADSTWKLRRIPKEYDGKDVAWKAFIEQVKAELRSVPNAETENSTEEDVNSMFGGESTPDTPEVLQQPDTITEFTPFMTFITGGTLRIPMPNILTICNKHGAATLMELAGRTELIPAVYADIVAANNQAAISE